MEEFKKDVDSKHLEDFNIPLSAMDRSSKERINKDTVALNDTLDQMDLIDIYRIFHPKEAKSTLFSNADGQFSKTDHMVGHKISLNKFRKLKSYQVSF